MLKAIVAKKGLDFIINKVVKAREIKKLRKYVEEKNELDIQMEQLQKTVAKQGKQLEQNDIEIALLKKNSHPPQEYVCCKDCGCKIAKIK